MQNHFHGTGQFGAETNDDWYGILRAWVGSFTARWVAGESGASTKTTITGGTSVTRVTGTTDQILVAGTENRPRNIALLYCIKT